MLLETRMLCFSELVRAYGSAAKASCLRLMSASEIGPALRTQSDFNTGVTNTQLAAHLFTACDACNGRQKIHRLAIGVLWAMSEVWRR